MKYTLSIVSMFKNESMIIEEWIKYYILQGVEHFYLIDNGSTDDYMSKIEAYQDKITLIKDSFRAHNASVPNQLKTYNPDLNKYIYTENDGNTQLLLSNKYFLEEIKETSIWTCLLYTSDAADE